MKVGDKFKVLPDFDIPALLRPNGKPSEGVITEVSLGDGHSYVLTEVAGKAVPYNEDELELV